MATCELCGKETRTSQGLRGHKTFVHGIRAGHSRLAGLLDRFVRTDETKSELESDNSGLIESEEERGNLIDRVAKMEYTILELEKTLERWKNYMALLATRNETQHLASKVKLIKKQVEKHDRWFNPRGLHEAVIDLTGGPIADLERSLGSHRFSNNLAGNKFRLKPRVSVK